MPALKTAAALSLQRRRRAIAPRVQTASRGAKIRYNFAAFLLKPVSEVPKPDGGLQKSSEVWMHSSPPFAPSHG
jgi:hypothetical protein